jgi:hypothetical protein
VTTDSPDTIVVIHDFWVTPQSWEHWIDRYERRLPRLGAGLPGFEVEVEALNADRRRCPGIGVHAGHDGE